MIEVLTIADTNVSDSMGGIYNSSIFSYQNNYYIIGRCESIPENERSNRIFEKHSAILFKLDLEFKILEWKELKFIYSGFMGQIRVEDFRVFSIDDKLMVNHTLIHTYPFRITTQSLSILDIEKATLTYVPFEVELELNKVEKNWLFFEHENQIKLIYSISPFTILTSDKKLLNFKKQKTEFNYLNSDFYISGSTNPISINEDYYLSFYHYRDKYKVYHNVPFLIEKKTLSFKEITKKPLFSGGNSRGLRKNVLYLMSLLKISDEILFSFGEGDSQTLVKKTKIENLW